MKIGFNNIHECIIPIDDFILKWRFTEEKYEVVLPQQHLNQLKPLNTKGSRFLWDFVMTTDLHIDVPFRHDFFSCIDKANLTDDNEQAIKKWLYHRGIAFNHEVFLSWTYNAGMIVPWKLCKGLLAVQTWNCQELFFRQYEVKFLKPSYSREENFAMY